MEAQRPDKDKTNNHLNSILLVVSIIVGLMTIIGGFYVWTAKVNELEIKSGDLVTKQREFSKSHLQNSEKILSIDKEITKLEERNILTDRQFENIFNETEKTNREIKEITYRSNDLDRQITINSTNIDNQINQLNNLDAKLTKVEELIHNTAFETMKTLATLKNNEMQ